MKFMASVKHHEKILEKDVVVLFCKSVQILAAYLFLMTWVNGIFPYIFSEKYSRFGLLEQLFPFSLLSTAILAVIAVALLHPRMKLTRADMASCLIFSLLSLTGICYESLGSFFVIFSRKPSAVLGLVFVYGGYVCFCFLLELVKKVLCFLASREWGAARWFENNTFFASCAAMTVCWMPYAVIRYPAGIEWDAYHQIQQFLGMEKLSSHWPLLSTAIMGGFVKAGKILFDSYEIGVFAFVVFQMGVSITVLSYSLIVLKRLKCGTPCLMLILAVYSLVPTFPGFFTSVVKDALFSAMVLLDTVLVAEMVLLDESRKVIPLTVVSILVCFLRKNGMYIMVAYVAVGLLMARKRKVYRRLAVSSGLAVALYLIFSLVLLPTFNIQNNDTAELMSLPFQQVARYIKEFPNDITEDEAEAIRRTFSVENIEEIAEIYNPLLSDPVKGYYNGDSSSLSDFFGVWIKLMVRHPVVYLEASFHLGYGFFCPYIHDRGGRSTGMYIGTLSDDKLMFSEPGFMDRWENILVKYVRLWERLPVLSLFCNVGIHFWISIWMIIQALCKKNGRAIVMLTPNIIGMLVCAASPTWWHNGFRYALPVIAANYFLLAAIFGCHCGFVNKLIGSDDAAILNGAN